MKGVITTIQRLSTHDGPGIRSTLFLKGCNLRCIWCHNPETWSRFPQLQYIKEKCEGCLSCVSQCSTGAITVGSPIELERERCAVCFHCSKVCPSGALAVVGRVASTEEIVRELMVDAPYFASSNGGITISGGEPLLQPSFVGEVIERSKAHGIHVTVQTNVNVEWSKIEALLPMVDLWMCDFKLLDSVKHKQFTGADNGLIKENIQRLHAHKADLVVRTPVIPGINDSQAEQADMARWVGTLNGVAHHLLPFHALGFDKYRFLGMKNDYASYITGEKIFGQLIAE